jgi:hypothetical protein
VEGDLIGGCGYQKEVGVEALGGDLGGDPVGEGNQEIAGECEVLGGDDLTQAGLFVVQGVAMPALDLPQALAGDELAGGTKPGQQDPALLEGLANRGNPKGEVVRGARSRVTSLAE